MKYQTWLLEWLKNYILPISKQRTYERYKEIVYKHIIPVLGEYELSALTPQALQNLVANLIKKGNLKTGEGLSPNTVNGIITVIQNSLNTAYTLEYIDEYTANKIKRPKVQEKKVECFSVSDQKKMEKYIMNNPKTQLFGIVICLYTGLRIGELLALEWEDVDFANAAICVNKACHYGKNEEGVFERIITTPKTQASIRTVPIPKQLLPQMRELKRKSRSKYIISNGGKPISIRSYQRTFESLQKKLLIPYRNFHSLRHTFATRALECGFDVKTLSEILGHKSPTVTLNRYVHSLMEHKIEMMNKLGRLL